MTARLTATALLLFLSTECSTTRVVRLDTGQGEPLVHVPRTDHAGRVNLEEEEFTQGLVKEARGRRLPANPEKAARESFEVPPRSGWYGYNELQGVVPLEGQPPGAQWAEADVRLTQQYLRFCEAIGKPGDCRKVLMNSPVLKPPSSGR